MLPGCPRRDGPRALLGSLWAGRALGAAEIAIAVSALVFGGRLAAALVAACYVGFALFTARCSRWPEREHRGLLRAEESPATPVHVAVNTVIAGAAALAVGWPTSGIGRGAERPAGGRHCRSSA